MPERVGHAHAPLALDPRDEGVNPASSSGTPVAFTSEQLRAIRARGPLVALSAGAGSGKTMVLVERFLDLVREGHSPANILAITYTEKAAAEMKERIVRRFEEAGDEPNRRAAESAYISTIHGFCARLLRENALSAGIDPAFRVVDGMMKGMFLDEQLDGLYGDPWFLNAKERFRAPWQGDTRSAGEAPALFDLICDAALQPAEFGRGAPAESAFDIEGHVAAALRRCDAYWEEQCAAARDTLIAARDMLCGLEVGGPKRQASYARFVALVRPLANDSVIDPEWAREFCECTGFTASVKDACVLEVRALVQAVRPVFAGFQHFDRDAEAELERAHAAPLKVEIHRRARELREAYDAWKRNGNFLDFEDLQRRALMLLRQSEVQREYRGLLRHILLDEAQDTNDIQMELLEALRTPEHGVFAVGDVKQAIYGFRGANVDLFRALHAGAGDGRLSLVDNYRSRDVVLHAVNEGGRRMWSSDTQLTFDPLIARRPYPPLAGAEHVTLQVIEQRSLLDPQAGKERAEPADDVREREATAMAAWIRAAVEGDGTQPPMTVTDRATGELRAARYSDIAVLAMKRKPFDWYERSLAALGVPFVKDGGRGFFVGREVQDLLALMRVVLNPLDDLQLLAALRSPLFGWLDSDLVRLREAAGEGKPLWRGLKSCRPSVPRSGADTLSVIADLRHWSAFLAPAGLIELACERTAYRATLLRAPRGRAQVANIEKLMEFARASAILDGPGLDSFVRRAKLAERHLGSESDAPVASTGEDVVTLSTIHGAKGLEWPIVILAALDSDFARADSGSRYVAPDEALLLEVRHPVSDERVCLASNEVLKAAAKARDEAEAKRLFYVAMTRAREYLVLTGRATDTPPKPKRFAAPLPWLLSELGIAAPPPADGAVPFGAARVHLRWLTFDRISALRDPVIAAEQRALLAARAAVRKGAPAGWAVAEGDEELARGAVERVMNPPPTAPPMAIAMTTVTRLVYFARCPLVYYHNLVLQVEEHPTARQKAVSADPRPLSALERGSRVHELLEVAELHAEPQAEAARLMAQLERVADADRLKIGAMLGKVLRDPLLDRARKAKRIEREYPFYLDLAGTTVQGVIDLVFEDEHGRGVVVDYKSNDLAAPDRINVLSEHYRPQIELYALAARRAGLVEPAEATLYFLNTAEARTREVTAARLEAVQREAEAMIATIARGAWDTEPGEKCRRCGYRARGFCETGKKFVE